MARKNPYDVVRDFEQALCDYTGARYAVATTSCTMALMLACKHVEVQGVRIPKRTYISVPMSIIHAGGYPIFEDREWLGMYELHPYGIFDCARIFTGHMYIPGTMMCLSFHWSKTLGIGQGGAILHDDPDADQALRRLRFDGRMEGVAPIDDQFDLIGYHAYMSPQDAAEGLSRLALLPDHNAPLPNDLYPDLSKMEIFK